MTKKKNRRQLHRHQIKKLIELASKARKYALAPYTGIKVGAAILTKSGKIYTGTNFQSIIPDASICAERNAIFKALSEGERDFLLVAVVGFKKDFIYPCGTCRQVLAEYSGNAKIIAANLKGDYKIVPLSRLTPNIPIL